MVLSVFDDWYSVRIVQNSQKTVKQQKMTIGVQIVTCLHRVRRIHKAAQTPLPRVTSVTYAWTVATARRPWARLTLCVYMDVHASGYRSLPRAATLSYLLIIILLLLLLFFLVGEPLCGCKCISYHLAHVKFM